MRSATDSTSCDCFRTHVVVVVLTTPVWTRPIVLVAAVVVAAAVVASFAQRPIMDHN